MSDMPNSDRVRQTTSSLGEYTQAVHTVAQSAKHSLAIFTRDLEPRIYAKSDFVEIVKNLILDHRNARVRVLVVDPTRATKEGNRFVTLAKRLSSFVEFRRVYKGYKHDPRAFLIADDRGIVYRRQAVRWEGFADTDNRVLVADYLEYFDEVWNASTVELEMRQLRL